MGMGLPVWSVLTHLAILAIGSCVFLYGYWVEGELQAQGFPWKLLRLCCIGSRENKTQTVHQFVLHALNVRKTDASTQQRPASLGDPSSQPHEQDALVPAGLPTFPSTHLVGAGQISSCAVQSLTPAAAQ